MSNKSSNNNDKKKSIWLIKVFIITFTLSIFFNYVSSEMVDNLNTVVSIILLIVVILTGIVFDLIATAVTAANEVPFHARAADKKRGAKQSVKLIKNADRVSNVCADVIGDVCGVLSGATSALIAVSIANSLGMQDITIITMLMTATVTACTVLGKGIWKHIGISKANEIINILGICLDFFSVKKK